MVFIETSIRTESREEWEEYVGYQTEEQTETQSETNNMAIPGIKRLSQNNNEPSEI